MTIRAFVAELIWWDNLEVIAYFKASNCYKLEDLLLQSISKNQKLFNIKVYNWKCIFKTYLEEK